MRASLRWLTFTVLAVPALLLLGQVGAVIDAAPDSSWWDGEIVHSWEPPDSRIADHILASRPDVSCTATFAGDDDELTTEFACIFLVARNEPIAADIEAGRIGVLTLLSAYVRTAELELEPALTPLARSTELTEDRRRLRLTVSGSIDLSRSDGDLVLALHKWQRGGPGVSEPGWPIEWTIHTRRLSLTGIDGNMDLLEWRTGVVRFETRTDSDVDLVFQLTTETSIKAIEEWRAGDESNSRLLDLLVDGFPFGLLVTIAPYVLFTLLVRRRFEYLYRWVRPFALAYLGGGVAIGTVVFGDDVFVGGWLWLNAGPVLIALLRHTSGSPPLPRTGLVIYAVVVGTLLTGGFLILATLPGAPVAWLASQLALGSALAMLAATIVGGRSWRLTAIVVGAGSAAASMLPLGIAWLSHQLGNEDAGPFSLLVQLVLGIPLFLLTRHITRNLFTGGSELAGLLPLIALFSLLSVPMLIEEPQFEITHFWPGFMWRDAVYDWATAGGFLLLLLLASAMKDDVRRAVPYRDSSALVVLSTASAVVVTSLDSSDYGWHLLAAQALLPLLYGFLLRHRLSGRADALGRVTPAAHSRLIRAEIRRRHVTRALTSMLRTSPAKTGDGDQVDVPTTLRSISEMEEIESPRRWTRSDYVPLPVAALSNSGGATRTANARAGAIHGFLLSLPIALFEIVVAVQSDQPLDLAQYDTIDLLSVLAVLFKWVLYGALAGYYYPLLRGGNPIAKFGGLLALVVTVEMVAFARKLDDSTTLLQTGLIRLGILVFFFLAMGLLWERRLTVLAGVPWLRLRDFRSVRALATPVTTVLVAGATVLTTTLTTAAINPVLEAPTSQEDSQETSSETTSSTNNP